MMVLYYCTILTRVKIVTPRGVKFLGDENNSEKIGQEGFCIMCGEALKNNQVKFCSLNCVGDRNTARKKANEAVKACPICNETLHFKNANQTTCSRKCGSILAQQTRALNKGVGGMLAGVCLTRSGKYKAQATINGKRKHIGMFLTQEEAHTAYLKASKND